MPMRRLALLTLIFVAACAEGQVRTTLIDDAGNQTHCVGQVVNYSFLNSDSWRACTPDNPATQVATSPALSPGKATLDVSTAAVQGAAFFLPFAFAQGWLP
jgi:hypothetical protein